MFTVPEPADRVRLCESVAVDLESAVAAGLVGPLAMLAGPLGGVIHRKVRDQHGVLSHEV
jgi:hypothetical protein